MYTLTSQTLDSLTTIRSFDRIGAYIETFHSLQDKHTSAWDTYICINRWMSQYLGLVSVIYYAVLVISAFALRGSGIYMYGAKFETLFLID